MSVEAVASLSSDQARADAASLRLDAALALEHADPTKGTDVERGHVAAASAQADLAAADAAVSADHAVAVAPAASQAASSSDHVGVHGHIVDQVA